MFSGGVDKFDHTAELNAESMEEARAAGKSLSEALKALVTFRFDRSRGYQVYTSVAGGEFTGTVRSSNFDARIRATVGQNSQYGTGAAPRLFYSLNLDAEARIPSVANADRAGERVADIGTWVGVAGGGLGLGVLLWTMSLLTGWVVISLWMLLGALAIGGAAGAGAGRAIGNWIAASSASRAADDPRIMSATGDWSAFRDEALARLSEAAP